LLRLQRADQQGPLIVSSLELDHGASDDIEAISTALGRIWVAGVEVPWRPSQENDKPRRVPLPSYPFERKRYWLDESGIAHRPNAPVPAAAASASAAPAPSSTAVTAILSENLKRILEASEPERLERLRAYLEREAVKRSDIKEKKFTGELGPLGWD